MDFENVFERICVKLGLDPEDFSHDVNLVSMDEMAALNKQHMSKEGATDVLSFPLTNYPALTPLDINPEDGKVMLGDVVICPEFAEVQGTEIAFLYTHGVLHLFGYTHDTDEDYNVMMNLTKEILGNEQATH